jgi:hypothetical protein
LVGGMLTVERGELRGAGIGGLGLFR